MRHLSWRPSVDRLGPVGGYGRGETLCGAASSAKLAAPASPAWRRFRQEGFASLGCLRVGYAVSSTLRAEDALLACPLARLLHFPRTKINRSEFAVCLLFERSAMRHLVSLRSQKKGIFSECVENRAKRFFPCRDRVPKFCEDIFRRWKTKLDAS